MAEGDGCPQLWTTIALFVFRIGESATQTKRQTPWRRDFDVLERLPKVERMSLTGKSNRAIAAVLGVDEKTIRLDLDRLAELRREHLKAEQDDLRAEAIARLTDLYLRDVEYAELDNAREHAVLFGEPYIDADGKMHDVSYDQKGSAQYRSNKAALLSAAEKAVMDIAKLQGLVVDKADLTSGGQPLVKAYIGVDLGQV
jgi:hypothetical protein